MFFPCIYFRIQFEAWQKFKFWFSFQNYFHFDSKVLGHKSRCKMSFLISQKFANKRNAPTGSFFVFLCLGGGYPNNKILISPHGATVQLGLNLWDNFDWVGLGRKNGNWRLKNGNWSLYLFCKYFFEHFLK